MRDSLTKKNCERDVSVDTMLDTHHVDRCDGLTCRNNKTNEQHPNLLYQPCTGAVLSTKSQQHIGECSNFTKPKPFVRCRRCFRHD
jgi:hypothetical protein